MFASPSIQTLPEEVLIHIFSYLSLGEVCNTVSKVCTQWERLHWDRALYIVPGVLGERITNDLAKSLELMPTPKSSFTSPYFDEVHISKTIKTCLERQNELTLINNRVAYKFACTDTIVMLSQMQAVTLRFHRYWLSMEVSDLLKYCVSLEELKIDSYIKNSDVISLCDQLRGTLRVLHVGCEDWTLKGVKAITRCRHLEDLAILNAYQMSDQCLLAISKMSSLRRLMIDECYHISATTWISMFSYKALKDLTSLHLNYCNFDDTVALVIGANLKKITELYLVSGFDFDDYSMASEPNLYYDLTNAHVMSLCDQLHGTLRVLHVEGVGWTLEGVNAITKCRHLEDLAILDAYELSEQCLLAISNMSSLRSLKIKECEATATTWSSMFSNDALKGLTSLHLHRCNFNDSTAVVIGSNLKNLIKLYLVSWLKHSCFHVCRSGLESIIKGCDKLTTLELQCGLRSDKYAEISLFLPEYLPGLKKLEITTRTITCSWIPELKKKMPDLLVMHKFI